mgnify:CR=1 FL=1
MGSSYSDMYSFIEDNSSISHSFSFLNGNPNHISHTQNGNNDINVDVRLICSSSKDLKDEIQFRCLL